MDVAAKEIGKEYGGETGRETTMMLQEESQQKHLFPTGGMVKGLNMLKTEQED